jgi:hypothetical protein
MYKKSQVQPLLIVPTRTSIIDASLPSAVSQGYFLKRSALTGIGLSHGRLLTSPLFPSLLPRIQYRRRPSHFDLLQCRREEVAQPQHHGVA